MIRFRLSEVLKQKGWTPYRLSQETGLTVPTAYRLADPRQEFGRFTTDTLDRLCSALEIQPGDLLEWVPAEPDGRRRAERRRQETG
jgi:putative transcriptional regulator